MTKIDYKSAGVDIDAGNEAVERIKSSVKGTHNVNVLTELGSFGSLFDLKSVVAEYRSPVLVQSIDGVGTKTIVARMMNKYDTIGIDLVSACCNDITVMGAKPLTFLDYIANDKLDPAKVEAIVKGISNACKENGIAIVGGETAEMPNTYLKGEHDIVGIVTGIVEKDKIIDGSKSEEGDIVLGLPSTGLQTNGYSLARKLFFGLGNYGVGDMASGLKKTVGESLLEPAYVYHSYIQTLLDNKISIKGMAHISGGGLIENIPRILPIGTSVVIQKDTWSVPPIFTAMQKIGNIAESEMYRTFNMGIGLVIIVSKSEIDEINSLLRDKIAIYNIGKVVSGDRATILK
jgi:phosphoribosylformylglycinamidine cyclo-ligase